MEHKCFLCGKSTKGGLNEIERMLGFELCLDCYFSKGTSGESVAQSKDHPIWKRLSNEQLMKAMLFNSDQFLSAVNQNVRLFGKLEWEQRK